MPAMDLNGTGADLADAERRASAERTTAGVDRLRAQPHTYAALDLGTNNCRLLIARPAREGFRIVDAFSRIVRLGEGVSASGHLSEAAIRRTLGALEICRDKMDARGVTRARLIATEACRMAENGEEFIARVSERTGLELEIEDRETEAQLAAAGCAALADAQAKGVVLFDIGGGSSEIVWLARGATGQGADIRSRVRHWASRQLGVVTLAEKFGGYNVDPDTFEAMIDHVWAELADFRNRVADEMRCDNFHLLGTSGTVTTLAGVHLNLLRYDRRRVDGLWMSENEVDGALDRLRAMSYDDRVANGCIGAERADLVLAGCAILEAIRLAFPADRVRIADRGLREGILAELMGADGVWRDGERVREHRR
ncbi:MAG: Ppx/GppA phosphatase [Hyphomicrobiales bacterium]|nr:Ppx/GppA phosphatase [Hyphomicrobiales bacterium]